MKFCDFNLHPVLTQLKARCASWGTLLLNLLGRISLIKIVFLPKFNYLFRNSPVWIPGALFKDPDSCVVAFIWGLHSPVGKICSMSTGAVRGS